MNISCQCPKCHTAFVMANAITKCPRCAAAVNATMPGNGELKTCACCGCDELYRRKDFPQWLGMAFLGAACILFFVFAIRYEYKIAWTILLGSAAADGLVYLIVGDVVICYRCGAQYRGLNSRAYEPFELSIAEKYRQERLRLEQVSNNQVTASH